MQHHHGTMQKKGEEKTRAPLPGQTTRFGRAFEDLAPLYVDPAALKQLGRAGGPMDESAAAPVDHGELPAGFVFLAQFIDHDITLDTTSSLSARAEPDEILNVRTPSLDLDCVYGSGREAAPYLYHDAKMILGDPGNGLPAGSDLPRSSAGVAMIGDPRNDENRLISQLQLGFLKFHNAVVDVIKAGDPTIKEDVLFERARETVRWHYQWMVLHDFLPRTVGHQRMRRILGGDRRIDSLRHGPAFIPVEFSVAAYRFGHSQVPGTLATNNLDQQFKLFDRELGMGFAPVDDPRDLVDWSLFFLGGNNTPQRARKIDTLLANELLTLPMPVVGTGEASLATRNLLRSQAFRMPSGQRVAAAVDAGDVLTQEQLWGNDEELRRAFAGGAPLWYYILREAMVHREGQKLGRVGGRIVAEVIIGLIEKDEESFLYNDPNWQPWLSRANGRPEGDFNMNDLITLSQRV